MSKPPNRRMSISAGILLALLALLAAGCAPRALVPPAVPAPPAAPEARVAAELQEQVEALAVAIEVAAREAEPALTALLQSLATETGAEMTGLEFRFKTGESIRRKIGLILGRDPSPAVWEVVIEDALRYTFLVDDAPPGYYDDTVRMVLQALEAEGHAVIKIKNYWPRGDAYSGVNSVLWSPEGLVWELQFHTPASLAAKSFTHPLYEEMRLADTPVDEKDRLFDEMVERWDAVPVPAGVLVPLSLHPAEKIILRPPP